MSPATLPAINVRWRPSGGRRYSYGRHHGEVAPDGSLTVYEKDNQSAALAARIRAINPSKVQRKTTGPRGGPRWVPYEGD